ncbi:unnamed protein product [Tetraodon nigroviridis]|uniref:(spotted green pufferfish) hypothetical protein n=1 Tax=Tetraodon nigroviridis TaxID=99883 RepID=Q4RYE3_TETNG|nr:unnamed protein product [Tetraodon nigroviridis]
MTGGAAAVFHQSLAGFVPRLKLAGLRGNPPIKSIPVAGETDLNPDDVPPYFKTEPARSQLNLERNRVVLTCMAEGSWPLEFKWIHNDTELTRFSLEYRYVIPSLDRSHAGFYRCIVRNRVGALLQRRTEVQVVCEYQHWRRRGMRRMSLMMDEASPFVCVCV